MGEKPWEQRGVYKISYFVKNISKDPHYQWAPAGDVEVEADSLESALTESEKIFSAQFASKGEIPPFVVDHVIFPNQAHYQSAIWDESGCPV